MWISTVTKSAKRIMKKKKSHFIRRSTWSKSHSSFTISTAVIERKILIQTCSLSAQTCIRWQWATASASRNTACKTRALIRGEQHICKWLMCWNTCEMHSLTSPQSPFLHFRIVSYLPLTAGLLSGERVILTHRQWGRRGPQRHWTDTLCTSH